MKVLLIGGGAREHAIATALKRGDATLCTMMKNRNPGIARISEKILLEEETNVSKAVEFAKECSAELAVAGPESPLAAGVVDALRSAGVPCVGPTKALAQIEASKEFMRNLMKKHHVPGLVGFASFGSAEEACRYIDEFKKPVAVKPVGLTGGKGVKVVGDQLRDSEEAKQYVREIMSKRIGGGRVVIEERVNGEEFTVQAFVDGKNVVAMPAVHDHKRAYEGDLGHNTGGMGSYSDANGLLPFVTQKDYDAAVEIIKKTVLALKKETGEEYKGVLYAQCMLGSEVKLIEFNCRFGDPEAMNVLSILDSNFVQICERIIDGSLRASSVKFKSKATVCKYVVPEGYGLKPASGNLISVNEEKIRQLGALLYYAAVNEQNGKIYTTASRSVGVVGIADTIREAEAIAESAAQCIHGERIYHRRDIGREELIKKKVNNVAAVRKSTKALT